MRRRSLALSFSLGLAACGASAPEAQAPQADALPTGRDCARAKSWCGDGRCVVEIDNDCKLPITCQLRVESLCQNTNGETGPADASTQKVTQLGHSKNALEAKVECGQGTPVLTKVQSLDCI